MYTAIVRSWHVHQYLGFWLKLMLVTGISLNHDFIKQNNHNFPMVICSACAASMIIGHSLN